mgnify:FL=1
MAQTIILRGLEQRALAANLIKVAPQDAVVTIKEGTRSVSQNSLMWAALSDIARAKPEGRVMSPEMWKAAFCSALGHEIVWQPGIDGSPPFPAGFRTSRMSKSQMADLLTFILAYGDRHGVRWSDPRWTDA